MDVVRSSYLKILGFVNWRQLDFLVPNNEISLSREEISYSS
jgi:hypothetical protein